MSDPEEGRIFSRTCHTDRKVAVQPAKLIDHVLFIMQNGLIALHSQTT